MIVIEHDSGGFPVKIVGGYFKTAEGEEGIYLGVTNTGKDPVPPFEIGLFHPKLGTYFSFPSDMSGPLLPDQKRKHKCRVTKDGRPTQHLPILTHDAGSGEALCAADDADFEFRLVLAESDNITPVRNKVTVYWPEAKSTQGCRK